MPRRSSQPRSRRALLAATVVVVGLVAVGVGIVVGFRGISSDWSYRDGASYARYGVVSCGSALEPRYASLSDTSAGTTTGSEPYRLVETDEAIVAACHHARDVPLASTLLLIAGGAVAVVAGIVAASLGAGHRRTGGIQPSG